MLVFISAFASPHTLPFGVELTKYYNRVIFINIKEMTQERKRLGYEIADERVEIVNYYDNPSECQRLINLAEDVILAGAEFGLVDYRISQGKRVFIFHERLFKKGIIKLLDPRTWRICKFCLSSRRKSVYLLAVGENAAKDFRRLGFHKNKIFRFGYFPETSRYSAEQLKKENDECRVLWVGRFVGFKRPIMAVKAFRKISGNLRLTMAGDGKLFDKTKAYADRHRVPVEFLGAISAKEVERQMLNSHILLSTSHKGEGWGAVVNEGMNRGCAIVCTRQIGCASTLTNEENAILFRTHSVRDLRRALMGAHTRQKELGQSAYKTVTETFNSEVAAYRFVQLAASNGGAVWETGLCSKVF